MEVTDFLGLTSHLTLSYWIGYILIITFSIRLYLDSEIKKDNIYLIYLIIIGLFLFAVPILAEDNARFAWSYYPVGEAKTALRTGYIDTISEYPVISYRPWPDTHLLSLSIMHIGNVDLDSIIKYMPLFWVIVLIFLNFSIKNCYCFSSKQLFLYSYMIITSFWLFLYYYGPQSIAYLIFILLFFLLGKEGIYSKNNFNIYILIILLFSMLVSTHLLTSIILLIAVSIRSLYKRQFKIPLLFSTIFIAWYIYLAPYMLQVGVKEFLRQAVTPETASFLATNRVFHASAVFSYIYLGIYIICIFYIVFNIMYKNDLFKSEKNKIFECFIWLAGIASMIFFSYGAEIGERLYIFSIIPAATVIVLGMPHKKILILIMLIFAILHIPTHYSAESEDMVYNTELQGSKYFALKINPETAIQYDFGRLVSVNYNYAPLMRYFNPALINITTSGYISGLYNPSNKSLDNSAYVIYTKQINNYLIYSYGSDNVQTWIQTRNSKLIYNNGYYYIYKNSYLKYL